MIVTEIVPLHITAYVRACLDAVASLNVCIQVGAAIRLRHIAAERTRCRSLTTDAVVPISRLAECIEAASADIHEPGLRAPIFGQVGDGNFHALVLIDPNNADQAKRAEAIAHPLAERVISMGGSCTGEPAADGLLGFSPFR
jgi:FAD/FMN-containing dehydrogenase